MKAIVKNHLNLRLNEPSVNAPNPSFYKPGEVIEVVATVTGDLYKDNNLWYRLDNGGFVWSGGVEENLSESIEEYWWLNKPAIASIWQRGFKGRDVHISVLDSGIDKTHQACGNAIASVTDFNDPVNTLATPVISHGTHCAGIIAGRKLVGKPCGVAPAALLNIYNIHRIVNKRDFGVQVDFVLKSLEKILKNTHQKKSSIINMSLSLSLSDAEKEKLEGLLKQLTDAHAIIIAAGIPDDENRKLLKPPGAMRDHVISVGALNSQLLPGTLSPEEVSLIDIFAPGDKILTTHFGNDYKLDSGASMATAFMSGFIGLLCEKCFSKGVIPSLPFLKNKLIENADDVVVHGTTVKNKLVNPLRTFDSI